MTPGKFSVALLCPAAAKFGIEEPLILDEAGAACNRANPVLPHGAEGRRRKRGMAKGCPIEIAFYAEQEMTDLEVVAGLTPPMNSVVPP